MTGKESETRSGFLEKYKDFNKITLAVGVAAGTAGILFGMPWLATLGFASATLDAAQIALVDKFNKKKKPESNYTLQKNGEIVIFSRTNLQNAV